MRTDIHSPTNFEPADYEYISTFDNWPEPGAFVSQTRQDFKTPFGTVNALNCAHAEYTAGRKLLEESGAKIHFDPKNGPNNCDHCGARIRYVSIFRHKSGQHIAVGNDCAEQRFGCDSRREWDVKRLKERAASEREKSKLMGKAVDFIRNAAPELENWMLTPEAEKVHNIFADMSRKLVRYGSLSEKQIEFARKLLREHFERQRNGGKTDQQLQWDAEKAAAVDCPKGRIEVKGEVLKTAYHEGSYGETLKLTVKDERGFVVWMTCPSDLLLVQAGEVQRGLCKGDKISVTVNVEPSDRDPKFGFGKRPTKAQVLKLVG